MKQKLNEQIDYLIKCEGNKFGIEVEVEYSTPPKFFNSKYWNTQTDGSLRGSAYEFVSTVLDKECYERALQTLERNLTSDPHGKYLLDSGRAGTHYHFNMQDKSLEYVGKALVRLSLMDPVLTRNSGKRRHNNQFCLPYETVSENINTFLYYILVHGTTRSWVTLINSRRDRIKYQSINIAPITTFGTIEYRAFKSTPIAKEVKEYLDMLLSIVYCDKFNNLPLGTEYVDAYASYAKEKLSGLIGDRNKNIQLIEMNEDNLHDTLMEGELVNKTRTGSVFSTPTPPPQERPIARSNETIAFMDEVGNLRYSRTREERAPQLNTVQLTPEQQRVLRRLMGQHTVN